MTKTGHRAPRGGHHDPAARRYRVGRSSRSPAPGPGGRVLIPEAAGSSVAAAMRLHRMLRALLGVCAEHLIGELLLLIGHRVVQVLESWNELLQMLRMRLRKLFVGLHVLDRVHRWELLGALHEG